MERYGSKYVSTVGTKGAVLRIAFKVHNAEDGTEDTQSTDAAQSTQQ